MASHRLIDAYLASLAGRLPADAVDELADGLIETWHHHLHGGASPDAAARAAISEFGGTGEIVDAFVHHAAGRRVSRMLLASGPVVGLCWGATLVAARAWTWAVPAAAIAAAGAVLAAVVGCLAVAATSRHSLRRTRIGVPGAVGLIVLDSAMLAAVPHLAPALVWPMVLAVPASLTRIVLTVRHLPAPR